ncbi:MAG: PhzF family phenazine biosynthesis protein [Gammaproteobacteria bacterium]|uniref:PhzF family phenazine biosynthesis protein n=1 Tax=Rhodoferax sp. TaxID=50421 RepID=UPI0017EF8528|nr:PhzF family phenazine biosynthesis protein [Rhodoferax sp.]MBU3899292.1 PhzF family phenazine biosynthesis protein [Gammaproteobacteria bacterium]MBA3058173.1 PhzF family phenazine biosynthesis protein [Rhodoferax sp.]MBU3996906.1 PhzF family phenazine biosynthesis protein [Gammaproteobacteria bacterium]MBU4081268.1 PhzF family phenazine biosynthesis protein [Gammaproteobacteria bacterium]MBU4115279.1 PhzF family phenazine biosynthesis protein [Gammaproteobacteria bacterium]
MTSGPPLTALDRAFKQVDVFTDTPYLGNPLAVVLDGTGLSDDEMQHFARWTNLSETTFVLPPSAQAAAAGADYQLRIFTTAYEMPFAGHPTLGSCHAWLEHGGTPQHPELIVQQCQVGMVRIRRSATQLAFAAPALTRGQPEPEAVARLAAALGLGRDQVLTAQRLSNGPCHFGMLLSSTDAVLQLEPDLAALRLWMVAAGVSGVGLAAVTGASTGNGLIKRSNREARAFGSTTPAAVDVAPRAEPQVEVRFFANDVMVNEDPVTGSFNASLAQWLIAEGLAPSSYIAAQGTCLGRAGRVHIEQDATGQVWVGGQSVTCIDGHVRL